MAVFNDITLTTPGLIQMCEALCSIGNGGISGDTTLLKQFTNYLNMAQGDVWTEILAVNKTARPDDLNWTDYPDAPIALVASQSDYTEPVASSGANADTFSGIKGIYYTLNGGRFYLDPMEDGDQLYAIDGVPTKYQLNGKSIFLNFQPSSSFVASVTNLHVEFKRAPSFFVFSDTTKHPGFIVLHHPLLAYRASSFYLKPINVRLSRQYSSGREDAPGDYETGLKALRRDYATIDENFRGDITSERISYV